MSKILAMYDIRGIQKYIFKTTKVKDAVGASAIIEDIIYEAIEAAIEAKGLKSQSELKWCDENGPTEFVQGDKAVQVLFIGGGNAYVMYNDESLCIEINRYMSKYVLEHTYSLQLAVAYVPVSNNYADDYKKLQEQMNVNKADMLPLKLTGALPVVKVELESGYPLTNLVDNEWVSAETKLKRKANSSKRSSRYNERNKEALQFEKYITEKDKDSTIAVVHIDGNNMGLRIRGLIENIEDYSVAVNKMRKISFNINSGYKDVFDKMEKLFNEKETYSVLKVLVAGDDITYVCNGKKALATVEYFCREISGKVMYGEPTEENIKEYGFSVCAGVSYIGSHFPFSIGYEVAEQCCESAKHRAKESDNQDGTRVGNFVDYHICKNVQAKNLKNIRATDYVTGSGENLCKRPYFISTPNDYGLSKNEEKSFAYSKLCEFFTYVDSGEKSVPRSFLKQIRNTYPLGMAQLKLLHAFLKSRGWLMPDETTASDTVAAYYEEDKKTAKWYDALELMDLFMSLEECI